MLYALYIVDMMTRYDVSGTDVRNVDWLSEGHDVTHTSSGTEQEHEDVGARGDDINDKDGGMYGEETKQCSGNVSQSRESVASDVKVGSAIPGLSDLPKLQLTQKRQVCNVMWYIDKTDGFAM